MSRQTAVSALANDYSVDNVAAEIARIDADRMSYPPPAN